MLWLAGIIAAFLGLAYVGRQVRLGKWTSQPWFQQFRAVRGVISLLFLMAGVLLMAFRMYPLGIAALIASAVTGGTVRITGSFQRRQGAQPVAAYSQEEIKAYQTLGLSIGAGRKQVVQAWKDLMKTSHPDQGGSLDRAKAINAARDLLLKRKS